MKEHTTVSLTENTQEQDRENVRTDEARDGFRNRERPAEMDGKRRHEHGSQNDLLYI